MVEEVEEVEVAEPRTTLETTPERYHTRQPCQLPTLLPSYKHLLSFDARFLHLLPLTSPSAIRSTTPAGVNDPVPKILSSNDDFKTCQEMLTQKLTSRMIVEKSLRDKCHRDVRASRNPSETFGTDLSTETGSTINMSTTLTVRWKCSCYVSTDLLI